MKLESAILASAVIAATGAVANGSTVTHLGSWALYDSPDFNWFMASPVTSGLRQRVSFGPNADFTTGADLFESTVLGQNDDGRILVADAASDADFAAIAAQLTNGVTTDGVFVETRIIGGSAAGAGHDEQFWATRSASTAPSDFSGYNIERIEMVVENISWVSSGQSTTFMLDTRLDFYGTIVPEPGTVAVAIGIVPFLARRRR